MKYLKLVVLLISSVCLSMEGNSPVDILVEIVSDAKLGNFEVTSAPQMLERFQENAGKIIKIFSDKPESKQSINSKLIGLTNNLMHGFLEKNCFAETLKALDFLLKNFSDEVSSDGGYAYFISNVYHLLGDKINSLKWHNIAATLGNQQAKKVNRQIRQVFKEKESHGLDSRIISICINGNELEKLKPIQESIELWNDYVKTGNVKSLKKSANLGNRQALKQLGYDTVEKLAQHLEEKCCLTVVIQTSYRAIYYLEKSIEEHQYHVLLTEEEIFDIRKQISDIRENLKKLGSTFSIVQDQECFNRHGK